MLNVKLVVVFHIAFLSARQYNGEGGPTTPSPAGVTCQFTGCGKWFNYKRNLDRHQRTFHVSLYGVSGQTCYFCTEPDCRRVFYKESNLHKHQRDTHQMDIPW